MILFSIYMLLIFFSIFYGRHFPKNPNKRLKDDNLFYPHLSPCNETTSVTTRLQHPVVPQSPVTLLDDKEHTRID